MLLKECITIYNGKDYSHLGAGDIPVYGTGGIFAYVNDCLYDGDALLLPRKGSLNNVLFTAGKKFWTVDTMFYAVSKNPDINLQYIYYYLTLLDLTKLDVGSTVPSMTTTLYYQLDIPIPSRETQDKIVDILSGIDNQIERNNDMVKKLQVLAHTIYQRWFEQFEFPDENGKPYKSSGGKMVWSDKLNREIPLGWDVCALSDLLCKQQTKYTSMTAVPTIDLSVMPADCMALDEQNISTNFTTNLYKMDAGDILFGSIRPYLHKAGIAPCDGAVAGTVHAYKPHISSDYNLCACVLTHPTIFEFATNQAKGTKMPVVSSEDLLSKRIAYDAKTSTRFTQTLELATILHNCTNQNTRLKQLKASLLPLLMNGQLCV